MYFPLNNRFQRSREDGLTPPSPSQVGMNYILIFQKLIQLQEIIFFFIGA